MISEADDVDGSIWLFGGSTSIGDEASASVYKRVDNGHGDGNWIKCPALEGLGMEAQWLASCCSA